MQGQEPEESRALCSGLELLRNLKPDNPHNACAVARQCEGEDEYRPLDLCMRRNQLWLLALRRVQ